MNTNGANQSLVFAVNGNCITRWTSQWRWLPCLIASLCNLHLYLLCCALFLFLSSFRQERSLNSRWLDGDVGDWFTADHLISCHRQADYWLPATLLHCSTAPFSNWDINWQKHRFVRYKFTCPVQAFSGVDCVCLCSHGSAMKRYF